MRSLLLVMPAMWLVCAAATVSVVSSQVAMTPLMWPLPQSLQHGSKAASLPAAKSSDFFNYPATPLLDRAIARYRKIIFRNCATNPTEESSGVAAVAVVSHFNLSIEVPDTAGGPEEHMDEWYELDVPVSGPAVARARTQWGALRALETFSQAVVNCTVVGLPLKVVDAPRFTHRGLLLDLARTWWSMEGVHSMVDAMAYSKLNVLHLHLTDSEAFPVENSAFNATRLSYNPEDGCRAPLPTDASVLGSTTTTTTTTPQPTRCTYSQDDLRTLVAYASDRGVRVVPEFDMPAHTAWTQHTTVVPGVTVNCSARAFAPDESHSTNTFYIDPLANATWDLLGPFLREMASVFPEQRMHIGTDEVYWRCYNASATLRTAVLAAGKKLDDDGFKWLVRGFIERTQKLLASLGKSTAVWNEGFDTYGPGNFGWELKGDRGRTSSLNLELLPQTAVEYWEGAGGYEYNPATGRPVASNPQQAIAHGHSALSTGGGWYLPMNHFSPSNMSAYIESVYSFTLSTNNTCTFAAGSADPNCTCYQQNVNNKENHQQRAPDQRACWDVPEDLDVLDGRGAYHKLLGGEGCLWGDNSHGEGTNASNVHQRAWPGGLAIAERLWSARNVVDWGQAAPRLAAQMQRLKQRGVPVDLAPFGALHHTLHD